jgi:alkanesulfonate monooxygenase SsuD/methylene tetrahydromethanopterin reductase-like flavin-dependent oxidoreductase (luciferase family)
MIELGRTSEAFGPGSISLGVHPHYVLDAVRQAEHLVAQAVTAENAGFDGVTVSEHHAGFPGYLPQPLLAANWLLAATDRVWGAPAPTLLSLRSPRPLAEELAWTAARFPGRVGAALAPGYAYADFDALGQSFDDRLARFAKHLVELTDALSPVSPLMRDPAVAAWAAGPSPLLLACNSLASIRRAVRLGMGVLFPGGEESGRLARLAGVYRAEGGSGPVVAIVTAWAGRLPTGSPTPDVFRAAAAPGMRQASGFRQGPHVGTNDEVASSVRSFVRAAGVDAVNVRVHVAGAHAEAVIEQIDHLGSEVLPQLRM